MTVKEKEVQLNKLLRNLVAAHPENELYPAELKNSNNKLKEMERMKATKFETTRTAITVDFAGRKTEMLKRITETEAGLKKYSTEAKFTAYQDGSITRAKAVEIATKRATTKLQKEEAQEIAELADIENAGDLIVATITIEWKRSQMWGSNPTAEMTYSYTATDGETHHRRVTGSSIGGCGYDKQSTAAAEVLNQCPEALKPLYQKRNEHLDGSNRDIIGYGSGYGMTPHFEGGVGVNCFRSIFEGLGYTWVCVANGKAFDVFQISKQ